MVDKSAPPPPPRSWRELLKNNGVLVAVLTGAIVTFSTAYYLILRGRELDPSVINNQILLFVLRNINVVLILTLLFVLIRNLVKLWFERRRRALGSKLKTKLVATYIGISLIPVLLLFAYATELLQGSIDTLFQTDVDELLEPGYVVSQALTSSLQNQLLADAQAAVALISRIDLARPEARPELDRALSRHLRDRELDSVSVFEDTEFVQATIDSRRMLREPEVRSAFLLQALRDGFAFSVDELPGREERLILAAATGQRESGTSAVVVAGRLLGSRLAQHTEKLLGAYQARRQLQVQRPELRATYLLLFLTVTLVILLTSSWIGLYIARRVTVPIEALADATRRIGEGDLEFQVEEAADDEIHVLVDSFNQMTGELNRSRRALVLTNQRLDDERARISTVLQSVAAGVISIDSQRRVRTCNSAAVSLFGLEERQVVGVPIDELVLDETASVTLGDILEPTLSATDEAQVRLTIQGVPKHFEVKVSPLSEDEDEDSGQVVVIEDLTELIRAQTLATWNEAARRIAHEIKNPLTPIKLSAERFLKKHREGDATLGPTLEEGVPIIVREVANLETMVDEFSRFARMPQPRPRSSDVAKLVAELADLYRDVKPEIEIRTDVQVQSAVFDADQIRAALINLLDNAIAATEPPGHVLISAHRKHDRLVLRVADTGPGIPAAQREKLFLPYYSTKGRGTGLGLAIVHRIVTDHQGRIEVRSNVPRGSVFEIELPQETNAPTETLAAS